MQTTQDCGTISGLSVPNNTYGWGRINVYAAVKKALLYRRTATEIIENQQFVKVSPNPFSTEIRFDTEGVLGETKMTIFNVNGQIIYSKTSIFAASNMVTIHLSVPTGIYFYKIQNKNSVLSGKLIKS